MMTNIHWCSAAIAAVRLAASPHAPLAAAEGKKVCYAFQDLSTGFWVAGHKAIVTTLQANGVEVVELNGGKDANRQLEQIKDCIAQGADGIILTADDGDSETTLVALAQEADVPIATFNRPPSDMSKGIIVVADNEAVARQAVEAMAAKAIGRFEGTGKKLHPLVLVGALDDPNAVKRREGFMNVINKYPEHLREAGRGQHQVELRSGACRARSRHHRRSGHRLHLHLVRLPVPDHQGRAGVQGKWKKAGEQGHVILGGLDGDDGACKLIREGYVDSTGVQDVYLEAKLALDGILGGDRQGRDAAERRQARPRLRAVGRELRLQGHRHLGLHGSRRSK